MQNTAKDRLDSKILALKKKLEQLRILRAALDDTELAAEMEEVFSGQEAMESAPAESDKPLSANMRKVVTFFQERANKPADLFEIQRHTKISRNSLRQLVYKSHADAFGREGRRGGGQKSLFWLNVGQNGKNE